MPRVVEMRDGTTLERGWRLRLLWRSEPRSSLGAFATTSVTVHLCQRSIMVPKAMKVDYVYRKRE